MNKYQVVKTIEYESRKTYTVFADDGQEAMKIVSDITGACSLDLNYNLLKANIKGTKVKGIIKVSSTTYYQ
jgi:hypothetical protein